MNAKVNVKLITEVGLVWMSTASPNATLIACKKSAVNNFLANCQWQKLSKILLCLNNGSKSLKLHLFEFLNEWCLECFSAVHLSLWFYNSDYMIPIPYSINKNNMVSWIRLPLHSYWVLYVLPDLLV